MKMASRRSRRARDSMLSAAAAADAASLSLSSSPSPSPSPSPTVSPSPSPSPSPMTRRMKTRARVERLQRRQGGGSDDEDIGKEEVPKEPRLGRAKAIKKGVKEIEVDQPEDEDVLQVTTEEKNSSSEEEEEESLRKKRPVRRRVSSSGDKARAARRSSRDLHEREKARRKKRRQEKSKTKEKRELVKRLPDLSVGVFAEVRKQMEKRQEKRRSENEMLEASRYLKVQNDEGQWVRARVILDVSSRRLLVGPFDSLDCYEMKSVHIDRTEGQSCKIVIAMSNFDEPFHFEAESEAAALVWNERVCSMIEKCGQDRKIEKVQPNQQEREVVLILLFSISLFVVFSLWRSKILEPNHRYFVRYIAEKLYSVMAEAWNRVYPIVVHRLAPFIVWK